MTPSTEPAALAAEIRAAAIEGRWEVLEERLQAYVRAVAGQRSPECLMEARELIEWARRLAISRKAALAAELAAIPHPPRGYRPAPPQKTHTWELDG